jgi:hypothetical protein
MKKNILAMEAAPAAIPPNPKIAAIIAMIRNVTVQRNMVYSFKGYKQSCFLHFIYPAGICGIFEKFGFASCIFFVSSLIYAIGILLGSRTTLITGRSNNVSV